MTPEERREFEDMKKRLADIEELKSVTLAQAITNLITVPTQLADLDDVDPSGVSNQQVLKYNSASSKWEPADDLDT